MGTMYCLVAMGVEFDTLISSGLSILDHIAKGVDIFGIYSPKCVADLAVNFGLVAGASLDLTNGDDFDNKEDQERAWKIVRRDKPALLIGSPPCTSFSMLQKLNIAVHGNNGDWMRKLGEKEQAIRHVQLYDTSGFN